MRVHPGILGRQPRNCRAQDDAHQEEEPSIPRQPSFDIRAGLIRVLQEGHLTEVQLVEWRIGSMDYVRGELLPSQAWAASTRGWDATGARAVSLEDDLGRVEGVVF